ncbi:MAG: acyltransferase [bacterium]|nr:acyltransferase [bacterium]
MSELLQEITAKVSVAENSVPMETAREDSRLVILDGIRGLAALTVVMHHLSRHLYAWHDNTWTFSLIALIDYAWRFMLFMADTYVWPSVQVFFLLSGFVIHFKYVKKLAEGGKPGFSHIGFIVNRFRKLYPMLIAAVILTFVCDWAASGLISKSGAVPPASPEINAILSHANLHIRSLLGTLAFLQPFFMDPYGSNYALWFLGYMGWYYILYPVYFILSSRYGGYAAFSVSLAVAVVSMAFIRGTGFALYPVLGCWWQWCLGAFLAEIYTGRCIRNSSRIFSRVPYEILPILLIAAAVINWRYFYHFAVLGDLLWYPLLGFVILVILLSRRKLPTGIGNASVFFTRIGDYSFPLYVSHIPVVVLLSVAIYNQRGGLNGLGLLPSLAGLLISLIIAYVVNLAVKGWIRCFLR